MPLPTAFDSIFNRHRGPIPLTFLRALVKKESSFNPSETSGPAWGLMQIVEVVRQGFNERYGTGYARQDLLNPDVNVKMGTDLLRRIMTAYAKHPSPNMKTNWRNPEFVKLLLAGWNSGYSEGGGVGKVASYLEARGIPVTHDSVFAHAAAAGATTQLQRPEKAAWQRSVADLYFAEGGPGTNLILVLLLAGVGGFALYRLLT